MAADLSEASAQFAELARTLTAVGLDDLRRELGDAIDGAAAPLAAQIGNVAHLRAYMPSRYADALAADLKITTSKRTVGPETGVSLLARAPTRASGGRGGRKIRQRNAGTITHPLFGDRQRWFEQTAGMRPGFFTSPAERSAPRVREAILAAMERVADKATGKR